MNKRVRTLMLVLVVLVALLALTGCVPQQAVDPNAPPSLWQTVIVNPLVRLLTILNNLLAQIGVRYSWGWAIILLTVLLKIVTLPLTRKQLQSTKATQELQPKLAELQAKYGKDRQKMAEEQMKLYKEAGVNPMGGCLPLLVQMPILFGLYQALYKLSASPEFADASFYWIPDLSFPNTQVGTSWIGDSIQSGNWAFLFAYLSLPILSLVSQLVMQKMAQPSKAKKAAGTSQQDSQAQMMNSMMMFMPLMFGYITLTLPAGLTLYWVTSNVLSGIQQYFVTGWGGLVDWFPRLKAKPAASTAALEAPVVSATTAAASPAPTAAPKPEKRRRRKK